MAIKKATKKKTPSKKQEPPKKAAPNPPPVPNPDTEGTTRGIAPPPESGFVYQQPLQMRDQAINALLNSVNSADHKVLIPADQAHSAYDLRRPTGIIELDIHLGGGFPGGGACMVSGPDNSGKTWLLFKTLAMQQRLYGDACRIAFGVTEGAFPYQQALRAGMLVRVPDEILEGWQEGRRLRGLPPMTNEELGLYKREIGRVHLIGGATGEEVLKTILRAVEINAYNVIACDSVNGLKPKADADKDMDDAAKRAAHASMMSWFWSFYVPMTTGINNVNATSLLFTQQVRTNQERANAPSYMQAAIPEWRVSGGSASKHYKLIDLVLQEGSEIKKGEGKERTTIGKFIKWEIAKGKAGTHDGLRGETTFLYDRLDTDVIGDLIVAGIRRGVIRKMGTKTVVVQPDTNRVLDDLTAPSEKAFYKMLVTDFEYELALRREVLAAANVQCLYR